MALNSKTTLKIIDAICEGPIEGLVQEKNSVLLNETRITGQQVVDRSVLYSIKEGTRTQGTFNIGSSFKDRQTTITDVNEQLGSGYSETLNEAGNEVAKRDYGAGQITRTITDTEVDFVELVFTIPKLFCVAAEGLARGQLFFAQIKLNIHICGVDGIWNKVNVEVVNQQTKNIVKGICTSPYQFKTQPIDLTRYGKGPYRIRVRKVEFANPEDAFEISFRDFQDIPRKTPIANKRADTIFWTSIISGKKFGTAYPFTATAFLSLDSEEYSTLPARSYEIKGLKVRIPSNATVREDGSLEFDSTIPFDGSLKTGRFWTTCPICCFYDMLTNTRYGAGDFIDQSNLNWVDLIELAQYCNELVEYQDDEGSTQTEPRFAINTVIGAQAEAYSLLQDMASVFRGMLFWKADNVQVAADHGELNDGDVPAIHVFSNSNVVDGSFAYSGSSLKTRSTRVRVRYNDPDNFYKPNFICIEDRGLIDKYGVQEKSVVAFGCTSKYQAQRMGRWLMQSEKLHGETVTFSVGLEGLNVLPGQVFEVSDEMRLGTRLAGRIVGVSNDSNPPFVRIDQTAVLPSGSNNKLTVIMKDGSVETRDIASVSSNKVNLSSAFSQVPPDDALYAIKNDAAVLSKFRCLSVVEGEAGIYSVVGVKHVDGIYRVVEDTDFNLELAPPFFFGSTPSEPTDLSIVYQQIDDGRNTTNRATISWSRGLTGSVVEFRVRYKIGDGGNWITVTTNNTSVDIDKGLISGKTLIAQVKAIGPEPDRAESKYVEISSAIITDGEIDGGTSVIIPPPNPQDVSIEAFGLDQVVLRWSAEGTGQKLESFVAIIRHSSKTDGTGAWANSTLLRKVEARTTSAVLPLLNGEYLIKFQNEQGYRSSEAVSAIINIPDGIPRLNFEVFREDQLENVFSGDKAGTYYSSEYDGLVLDGDASFDVIKDLDLFTENIDTHFGTQLASGEYFFHKAIDLGGKYSVRMHRVLIARALDLSDLIDDRSGLIDEYADFDGDIPEDTNVEVYFRKSDFGETVSDFLDETGANKILLEDGENIRKESDLVFDEWIPLENNSYVGRTFQFKAVLTTEDPDQTPIVDQLGVTLQFERRTENGGTLSSEATSKAVEFEDDFYTDADTKVAVGITAFDMEAGDYFVLDPETVTGSGFTITFKNGSTVIDRDFQYTAIGYGTKQS